MQHHSEANQEGVSEYCRKKNSEDSMVTERAKKDRWARWKKLLITEGRVKGRKIGIGRDRVACGELFPVLQGSDDS